MQSGKNLSDRVWDNIDVDAFFFAAALVLLLPVIKTVDAGIQALTSGQSRAHSDLRYMLFVAPGFLRLVHQLSAPFGIWIGGWHTLNYRCQMAPSYYHSLPQAQAAFDVFFRNRRS